MKETVKKLTTYLKHKICSPDKIGKDQIIKLIEIEPETLASIELYKQDFFVVCSAFMTAYMVFFQMMYFNRHIK